MRDSLNGKCKLFIENRDAFKAAFPWENSNYYPVCASVFVNCNKVADVEALKSAHRLLKSRVGVFSNFRGNCELPLVAMLAASADPEKRLDDAIELYKGLKEHFWGSEYLPLAAMMLSGEVTRDRYAQVCERTRAIYNLMKQEHPFLTSSEDSVFAAMLALSPMSDEQIVGETEACYNILKEKFYRGNHLQSLSHVLALCDDEMRTASDKCRDTARLFDILKEKKLRYGTNYELATLGTLATLPCGIDAVAGDIAEVYGFLKVQRGYGFWGFDRVSTLLHAAMIVSSDHIGGSDAMLGAAVSSTVSMIAAQQAAMCATMAACAAASNASHS